MEGLWLQEEAALQIHSLRDAEPQPVIPQGPKKNHGMALKQLRPGIHISRTATDPSQHRIEWQCSIVFCSKNSQLGPRNLTG